MHDSRLYENENKHEVAIYENKGRYKGKGYTIVAITPGQCGQNLKNCGHIVKQKMVQLRDKNGEKGGKIIK